MEIIFISIKWGYTQDKICGVMLIFKYTPMTRTHAFGVEMSYHQEYKKVSVWAPVPIFSYLRNYTAIN